MTDEHLRQLLAAADVPEANASPVDGAALVSHARRAIERRKVRRRITGAAVILLAVGSAITFDAFRGDAVRPEVLAAAPKVGPAPVTAHVSPEDLARQAERHLAVAERLWEQDRAIRRRSHARHDAGAWSSPGRDVERAAVAMVYQADRLAGRAALTPAAARLYREAATDFPGTRAGHEARRRLAELEHERKG